MKGFFLIIFALFIDGITAAISLGIFVIAAFPGTVGGAAAGCVAGQQVAGSLGCQIGAVILGFLGSLPFINGALAAMTVPVGVIFSFVISVALNATLGGGLIALLIFSGMFYPKYLLFGGVEIIPGLNIFPWWTTVAILSVVRKNKREEPVDTFITQSMQKYTREQPRPMQGPPTPSGTPPQERVYAPITPPRLDDITPPKRTYTQEPAPSLPPNKYQPEPIPRK